MVYNSLKGYNVIDVTSSGGELSIIGGGLILPSGTATGQNGMLRYNSVTGAIEAQTPSGVIILGPNSTYLTRSGGTITGTLTIADGQNIVLSGSATIDGVKPSTFSNAINELKGGVGFLTYNGTNFLPRTFTGQKGITITNGNGTGNPLFSINPYTLTLSGDVHNGSGNPVVITFDGATNTSSTIRVFTTSGNITDFQERVEDTVGSLITSGTQTGMTVTYRDYGTGPDPEVGSIDFTAKPYTISLTGSVVGSSTISSSRDDVVMTTALSDGMSEIILRGSQAGNPMTGLRLSYAPASQSSYIDNLSGDPSSSLIFRTAANDGVGQTALTLRDGKVIAPDITTTDLTVTNLTATNGTIGDLSTDTLTVANPISTLTVNALSGNATLTSLSVSSTSTLNTLSFTSGTSTGNVDVGGVLSVAGTGIPGMVMDTLSGEVGLVWDSSTDTIVACYMSGDTILSGANFGKIAPPTQDFHVGDRAYNDSRYVRSSSPALNGQAVTQTMIPSADAQYGVGSSSYRYAEVWAQNLHGTVISGGADVAERYHADAPYQTGTVMVFGGHNEITQSTAYGDLAIAGIISTDPAIKMNDQAGDDTTHPFLALTGRVPCLVIGPVTKGGLLVTSTVPGHAIQDRNPNPLAVIGRAVQSCGEGHHVIIVQVR